MGGLSDAVKFGGVSNVGYNVVVPKNPMDLCGKGECYIPSAGMISNSLEELSMHKYITGLGNNFVHEPILLEVCFPPEIPKTSFYRK